MTVTVYDQTIKTVVCVNGELSVETKPLREVVLTGESIPELPETLTEGRFFGRRRPTEFRPKQVRIVYRTEFRSAEGFEFDTVTITGPNIRKDGSLGEYTRSTEYWVKIDADLDEVNRQMQISRAGDYVVPEWLSPYVERFDPMGQENPFTAVIKEVGYDHDLLSAAHELRMADLASIRADE